jgi:serine/threonine protein kinase
MPDPAFPDALPALSRLHWYVLERVLGQGGFGITYLAKDTNLDQRVAIKEYLPVEVATRLPDSTVRPRTEELRDRYRWGLERKRVLLDRERAEKTGTGKPPVAQDKRLRQ